MRTIGTIALMSVLAVSAFAQGTVNWNNAASTALTYGSSVPGGLAGTKLNVAGGFTAGLYMGTSTTAEKDLALIVTKTVNSGSFAGLISGFNPYAVAQFGPGATVNYMTKVWSTAAGSTYEAALVKAMANQSYFVGKSGLGQVGLGGVGSPPSTQTALWLSTGVAGSSDGVSASPVGVGAVSGFSVHVVVPEPASASLLGLGLASLLIFRRRK